MICKTSYRADKIPNSWCIVVRERERAARAASRGKPSILAAVSMSAMRLLKFCAHAWQTWSVEASTRMRPSVRKRWRQSPLGV